MTDQEILEPMIRNRGPHERFVIVGMYYLLKKAGLLGDILEQHAPQDPNWTRIVSGHPMLHWNGKSYHAILAECGGDEKKAHDVLRAMEDMGIQLMRDQNPRTAKAPDPQPAKPMTEEEQQADEERRFQAQQLQRQREIEEASRMEAEGGKPVQIGEVTTGEPTFNGVPLSKLSDKTDAQLLEIEGFSKATVKAVRTAQRERAERENPPAK